MSTNAAEIINVVIPPLPHAYSYKLPSSLSEKIMVGSKVNVPLGKRWASGFVISAESESAHLTATEPEYELKTIDKLIGHFPFFDNEQLKFFQWIADYYGDPLSNVIDTAIPQAAPPKYERYYSLTGAETSNVKGKLQISVIEMIKSFGPELSHSKLLAQVPNASTALKKLEKSAFIRVERREVTNYTQSEAVPLWAKKSVELSAAQQEALAPIRQALDQRRFEVSLLHGVTGSGKTEVYIEAIEQARRLGLGALVLVPEIALTPQLVDRFRARLGDELAVLHSALNRRARWDGWCALLQGRSFIGIGARSAIFSPVSNLGLIIVDEEHDASYKQNDSLRYNARDLALVRAKMQNCAVILGSATPSLESYLHARTKKYNYLPLSKRHHSGSHFSVHMVDINKVKPWEMVAPHISPRLYAAICSALEDGGQVFVLYNRRGFASYLQCDTCQHTVECPNCTVTLTYHQYNNALLCHYCNLNMVPQSFCPKCEGNRSKPGKLVQRGAGTEKVFDELKQLFPEREIARLDRDAAKDTQTYRNIIDRVRSGETQILVGTQMIAKGHDLPGVTCVAIVDCDVGLHMPDFRAGERVFQLLTQASGRVARGSKPGQVILQTRAPAHLSIVKTLAKDFYGFAESELKNRRALNYPPYSRMLRIIASSVDKTAPASTLKEIRDFAVKLRDSKQLKLVVLGPSPAPLQKLKTEWRWHLLLKCPTASVLNGVMKALRRRLKRSQKVKVVFDIDPQEMM